MPKHRGQSVNGMRRVCALYIYMVWSYFSEVMRWVCAGHLYQDMARKAGSALAAPNLHKRVCARKAPAEDFGICAGYAPGIKFLAGLLITAFNDLGLIHGDMRRGYAPAHTGPIASQYDCRNDWGMRRICAGHKLSIPENSRRQNDVRKTTWSSTGLVFPSKECFTKF